MTIEVVALAYVVGWVCTWLFDSWVYSDPRFHEHSLNHTGRLRRITLWPITLPWFLVGFVSTSAIFFLMRRRRRQEMKRTKPYLAYATPDKEVALQIHKLFDDLFDAAPLIDGGSLHLMEHGPFHIVCILGPQEFIDVLVEWLGKPGNYPMPADVIDNLYARMEQARVDFPKGGKIVHEEGVIVGEGAVPHGE